jgi:hypothetical protein
VLKKIWLAAVLICAGVFAFAQAQPKAILSNADIDNFVINHKAIGEILEAHTLELSKLNLKFEGVEKKDIPAVFAKIRSHKASAKLQNELAKCGLGNNAFEKSVVLSFGTMIAVLDIFAAMAEELGMSEQAKEQIDPLKAAIHANDLKLITLRQEELLPLVEWN